MEAIDGRGGCGCDRDISSGMGSSDSSSCLGFSSKDVPAVSVLYSAELDKLLLQLLLLVLLVWLRTSLSSSSVVAGQRGVAAF